jgi:hypothetical protein
MVDRVHGVHERAARRELVRRRRVQRQRQRTARISRVVAERVVQRLDGMADGLRVEEVDENALGRQLTAFFPDQG